MANASELQIVSERLATLERRQQRQRLAYWLLLVTAVSSFAVAAFFAAEGLTTETDSRRTVKPRSRAGVLEAGGFVLKDGSGRFRAELNLHEDQPVLILRDKQGRARATVALEGEGEPKLALARSSGEPNLILSLSGQQPLAEEGLPNVRLIDNTGAVRASLELNDKGGDPYLFLYGNPKIKLSERSWLFEGSDAVRKSLRALREQLKEENHAVCELSLTADGCPIMRMSDRQGFESVLGCSDLVNTKRGTTEKRSASSLVLFGNDDKVLWSAP